MAPRFWKQTNVAQHSGKRIWKSGNAIPIIGITAQKCISQINVNAMFSYIKTLCKSYGHDTYLDSNGGVLSKIPKTNIHICKYRNICLKMPITYAFDQSDVLSYSRFFVPELLRLDSTRVIQMFMYNPKWFKQLYMVLLGSQV